ncbi:MAG: hypothetical protein ACTSWE_05430 [Promethearchaeota archaeon]
MTDKVREEIINYLLEATALDKEILFKKIEEKRKQYKEFVSEKGILFLLARDLGIKMPLIRKKMNKNQN